MTDAVILKQGTLSNDGTEQVTLPVRYYDNGDGTYSEQITVGASGTTSNLPKHDEIIITNNEAGSPTLIVYKLASVTVLTITNTYDGSNFLTHSVRS
jgi:hypothetical protein